MLLARALRRGEDQLRARATPGWPPRGSTARAAAGSRSCQGSRRAVPHRRAGPRPGHRCSPWLPARAPMWIPRGPPIPLSARGHLGSSGRGRRSRRASDGRRPPRQDRVPAHQGRAPGKPRLAGTTLSSTRQRACHGPVPRQVTFAPFDDATERSSATLPVGQLAPSPGSVVFHPGMATRRRGATTWAGTRGVRFAAHEEPALSPRTSPGSSGAALHDPARRAVQEPERLTFNTCCI